MTTDDKEIVSALRAALADTVGKERFELWFGASSRLEFDGRTLTIVVPNRFFLDWIRSKLRLPIENACVAVLGKTPAIKFQVDAVLPEPKVEAVALEKANLAATARAAAAPAAADHDDVGGGQSEPQSSGFARRKFATLESFVVGQSNRLAAASAEMVVRQPGQLTPLLIHGPTGVGKTHLLEGIWTAARKSTRKLTTLYLSAEQFTTHFLEALRGSGLPNFRRKYRDVGLLMIDDLQFLAGKRATLVELLHTVDTLLRNGRQLVFAADRPPAELADVGPELVTRLQSGMVCRIEPSDHSTRLGIVAQMARRLNLEVPADVRQFIASRLTSHAREISGALCRLQATSEVDCQPITLAMAEEALAEMIRHSSRVVRLWDIEKAVCHVFGLEPQSLQSGDKGKRVSHPRMLAMWLARKHTRAALSEIGHYFGRRSHSTVISAQKRVDSWMAAGQPLHLVERSWNIDDAILQVERQLMAG